MVDVKIPEKYSPLQGGYCRLDKEVEQWLKTNVREYRITIKEYYQSPMHMDSGCDPCKIYTVHFQNDEDAIHFKLIWGGE